MAEPRDTTQGKPPLIFFLATQLRCDVLGPYGGELGVTPHLDVLARHGAVFDRHFTTCPQGVPARASILTGLSPFRHGAVINGWTRHEVPFGTLCGGRSLFPRDLVDAGYRVVHVGIQHVRCDPPLHEQLPGVEFVGPENVAAYHESLRERGLMVSDVHQLRDPVVDMDNGRPIVFSGYSPRASVFPLREPLFLDRVIADAAARVIAEHDRVDDPRPLALLVHFWLAHPPLWAPRKLIERFDYTAFDLPPTVGQWIAKTPVNVLANLCGQLGAHVSEAQWREAWIVYLAMVQLLDDCIGQVLRAVEHAGWFERSVIAMTADHGEMLGSRGLYQKMCLYDPAVRVPLILKLPGDGGRKPVYDLTSHADVAATLLDACGVDHAFPGSLVNLARGLPPEAPREAVFAAYDGNAGRGFQQRMVRTATHKLVWHVTEEWELFDLVDDAREGRNLAGRAEHAAVQQHLSQVLAAWREREGDPLLIGP